MIFNNSNVYHITNNACLLYFINQFIMLHYFVQLSFVTTRPIPFLNLRRRRATNAPEVCRLVRPSETRVTCPQSVNQCHQVSSSYVYTGADPGSQVRGGALKKIAPSRGRREHFWGFSCEKSRFYAKKSYFFPILGGARAGCAPSPGSAPDMFISQYKIRIDNSLGKNIVQ